MANIPVDILLATHNGAAFIHEQVASILSQRYSAFRVLVRDDGSSDGTVPILRALQQAHSEKIDIVEFSRQVQGPIFGYSQLLQQSNADHVMFCDQDDVWLDFKIEKSMLRMEHLEAIHGKQVPILIHTDLKVVDAGLTVINDSFAAHQRLNPHSVELNRLLVKNVVTGCTMMINRSLQRLIGAIPQEVRMYDWWIAMVASLFGVVDFISVPTVLYRQHHHNAVGANPVNLKTVFGWVRHRSRLHENFAHTLLQAKYLLMRYGRQMGKGDQRLCHDFVSLSGGTPLARIRNAFSNRFMSQGFWRNLGLLMILSGAVGRFPDRLPPVIQ